MHNKKYLHGIIKRHPDGFGFFIPDDKEHPDVYIPRHSMEGIMTNDKVMVEVFAEKGADRFRGNIIKITSRGTTQVVGRFSVLNSQMGFIRDEGKGWGADLKIKISDSMGAKDKDLVTAEILTFPDSKESFTGKVKEVLGDVLQPMNDIKRVLVSHNISDSFSKQTIEEAKTFKSVPEEKDFVGRKDLRNLHLITIDGATAKDFDDAVCVLMTERGFLLYVAIADVSHYVKVGSAIDKDAYERGTSVYLPNFVVPMLPEVLSNGLCSLNPHVPRLCLVAEIHFDFTGETLSSQFYEAVMESKARVTYGEAQEIIDGESIEKFQHVKENILRCADLAKILMARRFKEGSLDLEIPETELEIDASGTPIDVIKSERLFSHRLIEELMLAANVAVAKFFNSRNMPALYRIHEPPNEQAIRLLEKYLWNFGSKTKLDGGKLQKKLSKALEEFSGKPEMQIIHILTLRSMSQAKYHKDNVGHFGLGFEHYTHFTSPIRRYPDLIVHRLLKNQVLKNSPYRLMSEEDLLSAGTMLSAAEQKSVKAERQIHAIKKARFLQKFIGQTLTGMVSSITKFGIFILLREYNIDGLIRLDDLGKDKFEFDEEHLRLYGRRTGVVFNIGDNVEVQVTSADIELGQVNFNLVAHEPHLSYGKPSKPTPRSQQQPRQQQQKQSRRQQQEPQRRHKDKDPRKKGSSFNKKSSNSSAFSSASSEDKDNSPESRKHKKNSYPSRPLIKVSHKLGKKNKRG